MRHVATLLLPLLLLALAGCGLAEKAVEKATEKAVEKAVEQATGVKVDEQNNSVTITGQDGKELTIKSSEDGKVPEGFPLPIMKGGKLNTSAEMTSDGKKGWTAEMEFTAGPKEVADFYEQAVKERGMKVTRTDTNSEGSVDIVLMGESDTQTAFITVSKYEDEATILTVMWGDK